MSHLNWFECLTKLLENLISSKMHNTLRSSKTSFCPPTFAWLLDRMSSKTKSLFWRLYIHLYDYASKQPNVTQWLIYTLRPRRNEQHFADDIFKRIFFKENVWISIKISLKFVPKGPINNIPALVQIMAWRRSGDKSLSEPMMVSLHKIAVLGFKCVNGSAPGYLQNLVELYTPRRTLRSSSDKLTLSILKVRTLYGERSFRYHCAVEWNILPYDIRSCESLDSFKAKLKTYLFSSAYH